MMCLSGNERISMIRLDVVIQYWSVVYGWAD